MPPHVHHLFLVYLYTHVTCTPCIHTYPQGEEDTDHNTLMLFQYMRLGLSGWKELQAQTLGAVALKDTGKGVGMGLT